ncbi:MFS transporter [Rothia sp. SD9660Na]|uniref:MFS transporter n=1 Tax=Rothia sp. SD9660Na TaxID=3047030 RepID=UPI0024B9FAAF|nr:MFS transporter [Rothia sp. SD9660Na]WHS50607.1 MFS transporter [Rothia sp. SD9660Na]
MATKPEPNKNPQLPTTSSPRKLMAALLTPLFMALMAISVVNVALTPIGNSLNAGSSQTQWVVSGYALAFGVPLVAAGRIGDATGRRRMFMIGVSFFTLGSLLSAIAPTIEILIAARVLQGLGAGFFNPQTTGIIQANFTGQARARAYGMFGTVVALAVIVGPVLGGFLIQIFGDSLGWRMMFLVNVPIGLAGLLLARLWVPNDRPSAPSAQRARLDLDPVGMTTLALAIFAVLFPFVERSGNPLVWAVLPIGLAFIAFFIAWEKRYKKAGRPPMLDIDLVTKPAFRNGIMIVTLYFLGNTSVWLVIPIYVQNHLGQSALTAALITIPSSLLSAFAAPWAGRRVLAMGRRIVMLGFGLSLTSIVATMLTVTPVEQGLLPVWALAVPLILIGAGGGLVISPNQTLTLASVPPAISGVAGGVLSLGQRMGTAIGTAIIPSILYGLVESGAHWNVGLIASFGAIVLTLSLGLAFTVADRRRELREG